MSTLKKPPAVNSGDTIGVMAPSSYVEREDIEKSKALLEGKGYEVFIHPQTYERHQQSAGTHEQKAQAFHELWTRDDIKAIWAAGGGNRTLNLLDHIEFQKLDAAPKALIGYSDITALSNALLARSHVPSLHGPVFKNLHTYESDQIDHALALLKGETPDISLKGATIINKGTASGPLIGGCLSLFQYLAGTQDCAPLEGALLFLEDTGDHISRFDRMFQHLKRQDIFKQISGLILGEFHDLQDGARPFGFTLQEIIEEYTTQLGIPVVINAPFGHGKRFFSLPLGTQGQLATENLTLKLEDSFINT